MQSLHFRSLACGALEATDLPLRMPRASGVIDPEPFRIRSINGPKLSESFAPSRGMRCLCLDNGQPARLFDVAGPVLTFVISGTIAIESSNRGRLSLEPGDIFLFDVVGPEVLIYPSGNCRIVQVLVDSDWPGQAAKPLIPVTGGRKQRHDFKALRMVKGQDGKSYFRSFDTLFGAPGVWSALTPLIGLRFIGMAEDTFIDWHPEIVNNLVIVMSGGLELEVGGGEGAVELFYPGDICLAQDKTGQGHIDRVHGYVQVAVLIVDDADLWPFDD